MSEEEIIEEFKELIYNPYYDEILLCTEDGFTGWHELFKNVLDLYNKEKEKNKELEIGLNNAVDNEVKLTRENTKLRKENHELENADLTTVYMNGFYDGEKKWKDKIKEIIKYIDENKVEKGSRYNLLDYDDITYEYFIKTDKIIKILEELLEERN